jgi:hypothetical protein
MLLSMFQSTGRKNKVTPRPSSGAGSNKSKQNRDVEYPNSPFPSHFQIEEEKTRKSEKKGKISSYFHSTSLSRSSPRQFTGRNPSEDQPPHQDTQVKRVVRNMNNGNTKVTLILLPLLMFL